ncbi:MAG TPA: peroxide stress protein YaaA [Rhodothermales bacterium]|nr:peroxide stress protein YaaA [Rhodothermales bacterium]
MSGFLILLPPAERKRPGGNALAPSLFDLRAAGTFNYFAELNPERRRLIEVLQEALAAGHAADVLGLEGAALDTAAAADMDVLDGPRMAALERYGPGVMYEAMNFSGLPTGAQRRLLEHVVILSGLWGLLRADDLIPDYRLSMDTTVPGLGKVSAYWRPRLSPVLNQAVEGRVVWNLLPGAHREAWDDAHTYEAMALVRFEERQGEERRALSHGVKPLRGALVAHLVRDGAERLDTIQSWRSPGGFRLDEAATTHDEPTRTTTFTFVR